MTTENGANYRQLQVRVQGTNINERTLLATDYLNHFNEVVMLLEMVADIPECLDDVRAWRPKTYQAHFQDSGFSDKALAIEAYAHVPACYLEPFERAIAAMNALVETNVRRLETAVGEDNRPALDDLTGTASRRLQRLIEIAGAVIHGHENVLDQSEIDAMLMS